MSLDYAFTPLEIDLGKPIYQQIFEFIVDYVKQHGGRRGAFKCAAKYFYPRLYEKDRRYAIKLTYENFRYALKKYRSKKFWNMGSGTFWNKVFGTSGTSSGTDRIDENVDMNMGYYINNHNGPIRESKFVKDSRADRRLFEFKKLVYAVLQDLVKPKSLLSNYIEQTLKDPRINNVLGEDTIWYNGRNYVKINKNQAALLYLVAHKIYTMHHGTGNRPERLISRFFEITGYGPRDLEKELRELANQFYDWLLHI